MTSPTIGTPATMGRRVAARAVDAALMSILYVLSLVLLFVSVEMVVVVLVLMLLWGAFGLWTTLARGALPSQFLLGLQHVDTETGRPAGVRTLVKYLVQGCTFGLAILITPLTIQAPNRSWFDRLVGVTLVDVRPSQPQDVRHQVAAPPTGWQGEESQLTQVGPAESVGGAASPASPVGMIQSVPFDTRGPSLSPAAPPVERPVAQPAPVPAPVSVPVPAPPGPTAGSIAGPAVVVTIDDGTRMPLEGTLILGRSPRASDALGPAGLVSLDGDRAVSANHLALGLEPSGPWVMDLRSTNGSWIEQDGRPAQRLEPMQRLPLSPGAVVRAGERRITVTAS